MRILNYVGCLCLLGTALTAQNTTSATASAEAYRHAIRSNDLKALQEISRSGVAEVKDSLNWTPLHYAALYGSPEAVRIVLKAGGDPNARSRSQATPLMFGAYSLEKTRLLVESGGDINATANDGSTSLWVATGAQGNERTVRYLLEKGANPKEIRPNGGDYLIRAAAHEDGEVIRLLLQKGLDPHRAMKTGDTALTESFNFSDHQKARILVEAGADVNAANTFVATVKNGPVENFGITPLMLAAMFDEPDGISALVKAGAKVDTKDHRQMTALMMAVATDRANPANVRRLINAGADLNVTDRYGETALDWAQKYRNPEVLAALEKAGANGKGLPPAPRKSADYNPDAHEAIARASTLLVKSSEEFFPAGGGCTACHHQPFAARAFAAMKAAGLQAEPRLRQSLMNGMVAERPRHINPLPLLIESGGKIDALLYQLAGLADMGEPATALTDVMVHYIAETQDPSGGWYERFSRPPLQESDITRTMLAIYALKTYGWTSRQAEFGERIARARAWLLTAQAWTTVDEADRIMGLWLSGADQTDLKSAGQKLTRLQRADGGWAQTKYLDSDAFGTSAALYSLNKAGLLKVAETSYQRGARFLLNSQFSDGSWYVRSRAVKLQPYFQSAFPFDHDQWISNTATAYAVMALAPVAGARPPLVAAVKTVK
jgi:ankyrin repeat protein